MAIDEYDDDYGDEGLVRRLRKEIKERDAALKERDERLAALETSVRQRAIKETFESKGWNPGLAEILPAEVIADEAAAVKWVEDRSSLFGIAQAQETPSAQPPQQQFFNSGEVAGLQAMGDLSGGGMPADMARDLEAQIANAGSRDELLKFLSQH